MRTNGRLAAIRRLLDHDEVSLELVRYFLEHTEAADTARGIADWWIRRDVSRTAESLTRLQAHGIVRSHVVQDDISVYAFTKNRLLRDALGQYVSALSEPTSAGA